MKNILLLLLLIATVISCSKIEEPDDPKKLDPSVRLQLNIKSSATKSRNEVIPGTWVTDSASFMSRWGYEWSSKVFRATFGVAHYYMVMRDTINNKLFIGSWSILDDDGKLRTNGVFDKNCIDNLLIMERDPHTMYPVLPTNVSQYNLRDTIGYIPNKVFEQAKQATIEAYNAGDIDKCYEIFKSYFYFVPTTGAKWRALKAAGIE